MLKRFAHKTDKGSELAVTLERRKIEFRFFSAGFTVTNAKEVLLEFEKVWTQLSATKLVNNGTGGLELTFVSVSRLGSRAQSVPPFRTARKVPQYWLLCCIFRIHINVLADSPIANIRNETKR
jgi:hypothetical protein